MQQFGRYRGRSGHCADIVNVSRLTRSGGLLTSNSDNVLSKHRACGVGAFVSTWIFVAAYLLVWGLSGGAAYAGALAAEAVATRTALSPATAARVGGIVLVAAGLYQLTPLKDLRVSKCRTPITFIMTSWRDGATGALRMGLLHGAYCLGCCWLLFVILFPLGIMNIAAMAVITLVIFAEKTLPWGRAAARSAAAALIAYGSVVVAAPQLLPTFPAGHDKDMPVDMQMQMPKPK
jgi:predicted metal-binding membrane protein